MHENYVSFLEVMQFMRGYHTSQHPPCSPNIVSIQNDKDNSIHACFQVTNAIDVITTCNYCSDLEN